jgi:hypothetical protein
MSSVNPLAVGNICRFFQDFRRAGNATSKKTPNERSARGSRSIGPESPVGHIGRVGAAGPRTVVKSEISDVPSKNWTIRGFV